MKKYLNFLVVFILMSSFTRKPVAPSYLGSATLISIGTADLKASVSFWKNLGFKIISESSDPLPEALITDGTLLVSLIQDKSHNLTVTYYNPNTESLIAEIESSGIKVNRQIRNAEGKLLQAIISGNDSFQVTLINQEPAGLFQPEGPGMRNMKPGQLRKSASMPNAACGVYGELSYPVLKLEPAMNFWTKLGFKSNEIHTSPFRWTIMTDGMNNIGLYENTVFKGPAITYYAPDMANRTGLLEKETGKQVTETGLGPGRMQLITPEGTQVFLFPL